MAEAAGVGTAQFTLLYPTDRLTLAEADLSDYSDEAFLLTDLTTDTPGQLIGSFLVADPLPESQDSGSLVEVMFDISPEAMEGDVIDLILTEVEFNDADGNLLGVVTEDGQITIRPPIMPGDVNEDERITLVDALFALQASLGKRTLSPAQEKAADVNGDSRITLVDALFILQAALGKRDLSAKPVAVSGAEESHPIRLQGWFEEEEDQARLHLAVSELAAGALDVQLRYNPEQLKWMGFEAVESVDPALVEVHSAQPGELRLARLGITAAGEVGLGRLLFQRRSTEMSTEVEVETVEFFDLNGRGVPTDATHFRGRLRALPSAFMLYANKPNPFNPETTIRYDLAALPSGDILPVRLTVYNVAGQLVRILFDEAQRPGSYTVQWNGHDEQGQAVSSGVYLYRLEAGDQVQVKRMLLLR